MDFVKINLAVTTQPTLTGKEQQNRNTGNQCPHPWDINQDLRYAGRSTLGSAPPPVTRSPAGTSTEWALCYLVHRPFADAYDSCS